MPLSLEQAFLAHQGECAALGAAACWACTALSFEAAGKRIGSLPVNFIRLIMSLVLFSVCGWLVHGRPWPSTASSSAWLWLSISAGAGYLIGDLCLFRAFVVIGARLSMLCMALWPPIAALLSLVVFQEVLSVEQWAGIIITVAGVSWVVLERRPVDPRNGRTAPPLRGVLLGIGGALGQAVGYLLIREGLRDQDNLDSFAAAQVRALAGAVGFAILFLCVGWWGRVASALRHRTGMGFTAIGAFFGPFLGVSLSVVAQRHAEIGVAATIISITPVLIIPAAILLNRERVSRRGWLGAAVAVGGVALLFLDPDLLPG